VWTLIDGGPGSSLKKSIDGGRTWTTCTTGLPGGHLGSHRPRDSTATPRTIYAIVEAQDGASGFYRSVNRGVSFEKRASYVSSSPQYYQEIVCDPSDANTVYSLDTMLQVTDDGGKTWREAGETDKHVDNHALWIDPKDPARMVIGCDGGLYETFDKCRTWRHFGNLPVMQFYRVALDEATPFYNVYGGTQDNNTLGGPSRTTSASGVLNHEWFVTVGGDGFEPAIDPTTSLDRLLAVAARRSRASRSRDRREHRYPTSARQGGRSVPVELGFALKISPHDPKRLWFAANRLFRSDDRGDSWGWKSPDLTRRLERDRLEVFGQEWSIDAVAKHMSTSFYGNIVAFSESPRVRGLLYVGTDDGLIQDFGRRRRIVASDSVGGHRASETRLRVVPFRVARRRRRRLRDVQSPQVRRLQTLRDEERRPWPYVVVDRGRSSRAGQRMDARAGSRRARALVRRHGVRRAHDPRRRRVVACVEGGDCPPSRFAISKSKSVRGDLVAASFGRGFFVLDDYTPLREIAPETLARDGWIGSVRPARQFVKRAAARRQRTRLPRLAPLWSAPNPEFGAVFTVWVKDGFESAKDARRKAERELEKKKEPVPTPSIETLRKEAAEEAPSVALVIGDSDGKSRKESRGRRREGNEARPGGISGRRRRTGRGALGPLAAEGTYTATSGSHEATASKPNWPAARAFDVRMLREPTISGWRTREDPRRDGPDRRRSSACGRLRESRLRRDPRTRRRREGDARSGNRRHRSLRARIPRDRSRDGGTRHRDERRQVARGPSNGGRSRNRGTRFRARWASMAFDDVRTHGNLGRRSACVAEEEFRPWPRDVASRDRCRPTDVRRVASLTAKRPLGLRDVFRSSNDRGGLNDPARRASGRFMSVSVAGQVAEAERDERQRHLEPIEHRNRELHEGSREQVRLERDEEDDERHVSGDPVCEVLKTVRKPRR
jgi:hypothetical protein